MMKVNKKPLSQQQVVAINLMEKDTQLRHWKILKKLLKISKRMIFKVHQKGLKMMKNHKNFQKIIPNLKTHTNRKLIT